jgi:hypothetical protein
VTAHRTALPVALQVEYLWESLTPWPAFPAGYRRKDLVLAPPVQAEVGRAYRLRLTARFAGSAENSSAEVRPGGGGGGEQGVGFSV